METPIKPPENPTKLRGELRTTRKQESTPNEGLGITFRTSDVFIYIYI